MGGDGCRDSSAMSSSDAKKYQPAFPTATYDTQGFCLKHPMIRVCRPTQPSSKRNNKSSQRLLALPDNEKKNDSGTDTTDFSEGACPVVSACPLCNPGPSGGGGGATKKANAGDANNNNKSRTRGCADKRNGLFYNRESSRDRALPPKERLLEIQQSDQRRRRREGDKSAWGYLRQRNLKSRKEIRDSGLTKGRGRSVSIEKIKPEGFDVSDSENSNRRTVSRKRSASINNHRSRSRSSTTVKTTPVGGGAERLSAANNERSRSVSLSKKKSESAGRLQNGSSRSRRRGRSRGTRSSQYQRTEGKDGGRYSSSNRKNNDKYDGGRRGRSHSDNTTSRSTRRSQRTSSHHTNSKSQRFLSRDNSATAARLSKTKKGENSKSMEDLERNRSRRSSSRRSSSRRSSSRRSSSRNPSHQRAPSREGSNSSRSRGRSSRDPSRDHSAATGLSRRSENSKHMEEIERRCQEIAGRNIQNVQIVVPKEHPTNLKEKAGSEKGVGDGVGGVGSSREPETDSSGDRAPSLTEQGHGTATFSPWDDGHLGHASAELDGPQKAPSGTQGPESLHINIARAKQKHRVLALLGAAAPANPPSDANSKGEGDKKDYSPYYLPTNSRPKNDGGGGYLRTNSAPCPNDDRGGSQRNEKISRRSSTGNNLNAAREGGGGGTRGESSRRTEKSNTTSRRSTRTPKQSQGLHRSNVNPHNSSGMGEDPKKAPEDEVTNIHPSRRSSSPHAEKQGLEGSQRTEKSNITRGSRSRHTCSQRSQRNNEDLHNSSGMGDGLNKTARDETNTYDPSRRHRRRSYLPIVKGEELSSSYLRDEKPNPTPTHPKNDKSHPNTTGSSNRPSTATRSRSPIKKVEDRRKEQQQCQDQNKGLAEPEKGRLEQQLEMSSRRIERLRKRNADRCMDRLRRRAAASNALDGNGESRKSGGTNNDSKESSKESSKETSRNSSTKFSSSTQAYSSHKLSLTGDNEERKSERKLERKLERSRRLERIRRKCAQNRRESSRESRNSSARRRNSQSDQEKVSSSHKLSYASDGDGGLLSDRRSRRLERLRKRRTADHNASSRESSREPSAARRRSSSLRRSSSQLRGSYRLSLPSDGAAARRRCHSLRPAEDRTGDFGSTE